MPKIAILISVVAGLLCAAAAVLLLNGWAQALMLAAGLTLMLTLVFLRRRPLKALLGLMALGATLALAAVAVRLCFVNLGWSLFSPDLTEVSVRGQGIRDISSIARMKDLRAADLSDNRIRNTEALESLEKLEYLDITGNGVSDEAYAELKEALPDCLILCEAWDSRLQTLNLRGRTLPDRTTMAKVVESKPALKEVDLTGSSLSEDEIEALAAAYPSILFIRNVSLGGESVSANVKDLTLESEDLSEETIRELAKFPLLETLSLPNASFEDVQAVHEAFPDLSLAFSCDGITVEAGAETLDFSGEGTVDEEALLRALECAPSVRRVDLTGRELTMEQRRALAESREDVAFAYEFSLCGITVMSDAETIDFGEVAVSDEQVEELAENLALMPNLKQVDMYESVLSRESTEMLFDTFPDIFFGWTIYMDDYVVRTDVTAFSTLKWDRPPFYDNDQLAWLRYCKNLLALDLGHNHVNDLSFLRNFPHLKVLILVDNLITDISPLADLMELEYVELFVNEIADWSPLANHTSIIDLNICYNRTQERRTIDDITPFLSCTGMKRCWMSHNGITEKQQRELIAAVPGCEFNFTSQASTGDGWRFHDRYYIIREMMNTRVYIPFPSEEEEEAVE